jgi:hypothetical protein
MRHGLFRTMGFGLLTVFLGLTSAADPSNATATRFGWGSRVFPVARELPPGKSRAQATGSSRALPTSLLDCKAPNLLLAEARPAWHGAGVILQ